MWNVKCEWLLHHLYSYFMNVSEKRRTWKDMAIYLLPLFHWNNLKSFYPLIFVDLGTLLARIRLYLSVSRSLSMPAWFCLLILHPNVCTARWMIKYCVEHDEWEKNKVSAENEKKNYKYMCDMEKQRNMNRMIWNSSFAFSLPW